MPSASPAISDLSDDPTAELDAPALVRGWAEMETPPLTHHAEVVWAARTDLGRVRENNEDKFDFFLPEERARLGLRGRLWAVADGMGGHAAGQIASEAALKTLIRSYFDAASPDDTEQKLRAALKEANALIYHAAQKFPDKSGMGTTLVTVVIKNDTLFVAHIGDSRAYLLRQNEPIQQITTDHSWVEEQVRRRALTRAEAEASPYRNYILRSVGVEPSVEADISQTVLQTGDRVLLCSDGLTGHLSDETLQEIISGAGVSQAVLDLVDAANGAGGKDNITALLLHITTLGAVPPAGTKENGA